MSVRRNKLKIPIFSIYWTLLLCKSFPLFDLSLIDGTLLKVDWIEISLVAKINNLLSKNLLDPYIHCLISVPNCFIVPMKICLSTTLLFLFFVFCINLFHLIVASIRTFFFQICSTSVLSFRKNLILLHFIVRMAEEFDIKCIKTSIKLFFHQKKNRKKTKI